MLEVGPFALLGLRSNSVKLGNTIMYKNTLHMKGVTDLSSSFQSSHPCHPLLSTRVHLSIWELFSSTVITFFPFHIAIPSLVLSKVKVEFYAFDNVHSLNVKSTTPRFFQHEMPPCLPNSFSSRTLPPLISRSHQQASTSPMSPASHRFLKQRNNYGWTVRCHHKSPLFLSRRFLHYARLLSDSIAWRTFAPLQWTDCQCWSVSLWTKRLVTVRIAKYFSSRVLKIRLQ